MNWWAAGMAFMCFAGLFAGLLVAKFSIDWAERNSAGHAAAMAVFWIMVAASLAVGFLCA